MRPRSLKFLLNSKSTLLRKVYFFYNIYLRNFKYLKGGSQFDEDLYLNSFFDKNYIGKFVDLGCFHPTRDNNTFRFYKKNWTGINVDLNPITIELFNFFRSKDININCAISDKKTQNLDIYPTIINFSDENEKLINNNSGISLLDYDKIPDDRIVQYIVGYKQRKTNKHQWTTIEKSKGGFLDIFKISNK